MKYFNSLKKLQEIFDINLDNTQDSEINSFQFDSRALEKGDVFIALKDKRDGHDFIPDAAVKGASACIAERKTDTNIPQFITDNSFDALTKIGVVSREKFKGRVIAVTGSCGKTTIKEMLSSSIPNNYYTKGNFNSLQGLPITLAHLDQSADFAILELGTDNMGNMNILTNIAKPDIAIITSIGPAHMEYFKTIENIEDEKLSIVNGLSANGMLVMPHELLNKAKNITNKKIATVSLTDKDASSYLIEKNNQIKVCINGKSIELSLKDYSDFRIYNAILVLTVLDLLGFDISVLKEKVELFTPPAGRGEVTNLKNDVTLYDDSYNANPLSMKKSLETFSTKEGQKVAVLGDMLELGENEIKLHQDLAPLCKKLDTIYTTGKLMLSLHQVLDPNQHTLKHFDSAEDIIEFLKAQKLKSCQVLVKGSKGSKVRKVADYLKQKDD